MKKIVVIGGGAAGAKAAAKAKRLNSDNQVELYTNDTHIAVSLCGLPYFIEGSVDDVNKLIIRTPQDFIDKNIAVFLEHNLEQINPDKKFVLINGNHIFYDELILALGASVHYPLIENVKANNVFTLRSIESAIQIKEKMNNSKTVLLVGAGYISIELTEAFIKNGLKVIIIQNTSRIANDFDVEFSELIYSIMKNQGKENFEIFFNEEVVKFNVDENNNFLSAVTKNGKEFSADFCVLATGARPNVEIARQAGINIGTTGAIYVDNKMRTNYEHIFACGDCCEKHCIITRKPVYLGLGTIANKEGRVAAINATFDDGYEFFDGVLKSQITKFFDFTISKTGLTEADALFYSSTINLEPISATITKRDKASYMPNSSDVTIKLVADKRSGELLGAQGIGSFSNVAQRINTIASGLKSRLTVEQLLHLDLPYAPPYSTSIDPILTAAYQLKEKITK